MKISVKTLLLSFISFSSMANTVYIPVAEKSMSGAYSARSCYSATNISDVEVSLTFTFYNLNGVVFSSPIEVATNISAIGQPTILQPKQTALFCLPNKAPTYNGYGQIDVVAVDGIGRSALAVAHGRLYSYDSGNTTSSTEVTINGGMPF